ncbi:hypothetical protein AB1N83_003876 [Pleurotus pulmonarius]
MEEDIYTPKARRTDRAGTLTHSALSVETKWDSAPTSTDTGDTVMLAGRSQRPRTPSNIELDPAPLLEQDKMLRTAAPESTSGPAESFHGSVLLQGNAQIPSIRVHHHSGAGAGESQLLQDASSHAWCLGVPQLNRMAVTAPLNDVRFLTVPWSRPHHCDERPKVDTRKRNKLLWLRRVLINLWGFRRSNHAILARQEPLAGHGQDMGQTLEQ